MAADGVEILVLVENWVDMLVGGQGEREGAVIRRHGLIEHFDERGPRPQAENGLSLLVRSHRAGHRGTVLFDAGLTHDVLLHNLAVFDVDVEEIDHVVVSHGHPDHFGGLLGLLERRHAPLPVITHPDAFLPRFAVMPDGRVAGHYSRSMHAETITALGGRLVLTRDPVDLGFGVTVTGEIPREVEFERLRPSEHPRGPGLYQIREDGRWHVDHVMDEHGLVVDVEGVGLVVMTGCAHAGVVNTVAHGVTVLGDKPIAAVLGGFHLGFPTTPSENVEQTVAELTRRAAGLVMPMHCSGLAAHAAFRGSESYAQPAVGTRIRIGLVP